MISSTEKSDWRKMTLGEVAVLNYGKSLQSEKRTVGNVPVYGSGGITGYHNEPLVNERGLIIGRKGTVGAIYKSEVPFYPIDTVFYITQKDTNADLNFLYYLLLDLGLDEMNSDSAVPGLNRDNAYTRTVWMPDLPEQRAIVAVLSSLDGKIELLRNQNKTLEAIAQQLFHEWFVEFNFPNANGEPYKKSGGKMVDGELGEMPAGWIADQLDSIVSLKGGTTPSTKNPEYWNGDIAWTSPKDLSDNREVFLRKTASKISELGLAQVSSGLLPVGTVLLSSRAPIGYLAISSIPVAINQGYIALLPQESYSNYFMYLWIKENLEKIIAAANGSTFLEISKASFKRIAFIRPTEETVDKFAKIITPIFEKISANESHQTTLRDTREMLLPRMMSGDVRVKIFDRASP